MMSLPRRYLNWMTGALLPLVSSLYDMNCHGSKHYLSATSALSTSLGAYTRTRLSRNSADSRVSFWTLFVHELAG